MALLMVIVAADPAPAPLVFASSSPDAELSSPDAESEPAAGEGSDPAAPSGHAYKHENTATSSADSARRASPSDLIAHTRSASSVTSSRSPP